jgi:hypothetical protein
MYSKIEHVDFGICPKCKQRLSAGYCADCNVDVIVKQRKKIPSNRIEDYKKKKKAKDGKF